ncbi:hypothetical protein TKK_0010169 [Trichogramma kaykai]
MTLQQKQQKQQQLQHHHQQQQRQLQHQLYQQQQQIQQQQLEPAESPISTLKNKVSTEPLQSSSQSTISSSIMEKLNPRLIANPPNSNNSKDKPPIKTYSNASSKIKSLKKST